MHHKIRLTADWTNDESGAACKAGDIVTVTDAQLRLENANGLHGKYSVQLTAPVPPAGAPLRRAKAPDAPDVPTDNE